MILENGNAVSLKNIMMFATGTSIVPRSVTSKKIIVEFHLSPVGSVSRPSAHTCYNSLKLPITRNVRELEKAWVSALDEAGAAFMLN